jgi:hypothetical protein
VLLNIHVFCHTALLTPPVQKTQYCEYLKTIQAFNLAVIVHVLTYIGVVSTGPKQLRAFFVERSNTWAYFARRNKIVAPYC